MLPTAPVAPAYSLRRWSYGAVLAAAALGAVLPQLAAPVLAPLLAVGLVVFGIAHGACDQLILPAAQPDMLPGADWRNPRYLSWFLLAYLGLAAVVVGLWWAWPAVSVGLFFLLTVWHWGSADAPEAHEKPVSWLSHSLLRGLLVFAIPSLAWPVATLGIINGLLGFAGGQPLPAALFTAATTALAVVVGIGHLVLWLNYGVQRNWPALRQDVQEIGLLAVLFIALPPVLSVGVYFVYWHSLQHVQRLVPLLGYATPTGQPGAGRPGAVQPVPLRELLRQMGFFMRRAAPLLLVSCLGIAGLGYVLAARLPDGAAWFSLALVVASVVTLPHALLVTFVMDAARWRPASAQKA